MIFQRNKKSSDLSSRFSFKLLGKNDPQAIVRGHEHRDIFRKKSYVSWILMSSLLTILIVVSVLIYLKPEFFKAEWKQSISEIFQQDETTKNTVQINKTVPEIQTIQPSPDNKEQQLNALTAQYQTLLQSSDLPVETFKSIQQQVKDLDSEHVLLTLPGLAEAFARETEKAIGNKRFERAHQLLQDWKNLLPEQTPHYTALNEKMLTEYLKAGESYFQERMRAILSDGNLTTAKIEQAQQQLTELHKLVEKRQQVETYYQQIEIALKTQQFNEAQQLVERLRALDPKLPTLPLLTQHVATAQQIGVSDKTDEKLTISTPSPTTESQAVVVQTNETPTALQALLQTCAEHLQANRLTSGRGGTALACYQQVLKQDPDNNEAKHGLKAIEARYVAWAEEALIAGQLQGASQHLARLAQVNPESPLLVKLREQLNQPATESFQNGELDTLLKTCAEHLAAKRLTSGGQGTAFGCYQQVLKQDPTNVEAKKGLQAIEETYIRWTNSALAKNNLRRAQLFFEKLQQVNPHSLALPALQQQLTMLKQSQTKRSVIERQVKKVVTVSPVHKQVHQPPAQKEKNVASAQQTATPKTAKTYPQKCNELFSQESLGIVPLTADQKAFQRRHCR